MWAKHPVRIYRAKDYVEFGWSSKGFAFYFKQGGKPLGDSELGWWVLMIVLKE